MKRSCPLLLLALLAAAGTLLATGCGPSAADFQGVYLDPPLPTPDVTLEGRSGPVRLSDFEERLVVVSFGYTSCPDVCPATLQHLAQARDRLGDAGEAVQVVFVSIDPARDDPERAATYASAFDSTFVGLSGTGEQVADAASAYGIFYDRAGNATGGNATSDSTASENYFVDHTATTYVLDSSGQARLMWSFGTEPGAMAQDLRALI